MFQTRKYVNLLPPEPKYSDACEIIDSDDNEFWQVALKHITQRHKLPFPGWKRINKGGNVLFRQDELVIKLIPPNWVHQGHAEIESLRNLPNQLGLEIPRLIADGTLDNWVYVVMTWLQGDSLGDLWPQLDYPSKKILVQRTGEFCRTLHKYPVNEQSSLNVDWQQYQESLLSNCIARHRRVNLPERLIDQILPFLNNANDYFDDNSTMLIHMDLHPWNLMVEPTKQGYRLSGVLDFGDAIIGRSKLLELATPIIFLCQGDARLVNALLDSYQLLDPMKPNEFQRKLMAVVLLRPDCDLNFVLKQVPVTGPRTTWEEISEQLFPI